MFEKLINMLMPLLFSLLPDNIVKNGLKSFLDTIEQSIKNSSTKIDDALVLPIIDKLRTQLSIEPFEDVGFVPGDLENRKAALAKLLSDNNLKETDVDLVLLNSYLLMPSGWQGKIGNYVSDFIARRSH